MRKIILKAVRIIDANSKHHQSVRDILIENETIIKIDHSIEDPEAQLIAIEDLHLSPSWFDPSVSFGEPGFEDRETLVNGIKTAGLSGFAQIGLNPNTSPVTDTQTGIRFAQQYNSSQAVEVFPLGALTKEAKGKDLAELFEMQQAGAIAFTDYKQPIENPNILKIALQYAQGFGGLVQSYPLEKQIAREAQVHESLNSLQLGLKGIPAFAEEIQIKRDLAILAYTGGKLHIPFVSTKNALKLIEEAKADGLQVTCGVAIHQLYYNDAVLHEFDTAKKVMPPLRDEEDRLALVEAVESGIIDCVTCDHLPRTPEEKHVEFEHALPGSVGLESAFGVLNRLFGLEKTISLLTQSRKVFQLQEFSIQEGQKASLSLFLPNEDYTFSEQDVISSNKNSIFYGEKLKGKAIGIIHNNQLLLKQL